MPGQPFEGKPLRSHTVGISGKPDCLIRTASGVVPVELKNASKPPACGEVYPSHMIQAVAYCALVEDYMKIPAPYALVIYAGQQVRRVDFSEQRRRWLLDTIRQLELARERQTASRNHDHRALRPLRSSVPLRSGTPLRASCVFEIFSSLEGLGFPLGRPGGDQICVLRSKDTLLKEMQSFGGEAPRDN